MRSSAFLKSCLIICHSYLLVCVLLGNKSLIPFHPYLVMSVSS